MVEIVVKGSVIKGAYLVLFISLDIYTTSAMTCSFFYIELLKPFKGHDFSLVTELSRKLHYAWKQG